MRDIIKMVVVLTVICAASGFTLALVQRVTKGPIEYTKLKLQFPAVKAVMGKTSNDPIADRKSIVVGKDKRGRDIKILVYRGKEGGAVSKVAFKTFAKGYHGFVHVMVGVDIKAKKISGIAIVEQSETPGRGDRILAKSFTKPFAGKPVGAKVAKGGINALSGATISTMAVVHAVNHALDLYKKFQAQMVN